jgi:prophage tail gpP-like protein
VVASTNPFKRLAEKGRFPGVEVLLSPLDPSPERIKLTRFTQYSFSRSVIVPVASFEFDFISPDTPNLPDSIRTGDMVTLQADGKNLATGIIDYPSVETDVASGERGSIAGRDLVGQFEDHDAISLDSEPVFFTQTDVAGVFRKLKEGTRIPGLIDQGVPGGKWAFSTEPGESKLAALQRYLEPLNSLAWSAPDGKLIVGKPDFKQTPRGSLFILRKDREANVRSIKVTWAGATIPNIVIPLWSGAEFVQKAFKESAVYNPAPEPNRLRQKGHVLVRSVVTSDINANTTSGQTELNRLGASGNLLRALAARLIARENMHEMLVQVVAYGHMNEDGEPYAPDQVYHVKYDRANVDEPLYVYGVEYSLTLERGQITTLYMCRLGCIVAGAEVPAVQGAT